MRLSNLAGLLIGIAGLALTAAPAIAARGDWTEYLGNSGKSGFNAAETVVTRTSVPGLSLRWTAKASDTVSTQPIQAYKHIFWGSWDGYERVTNFAGGPAWKTYLGQSTVACDPGRFFGVTDTPKVATVWANGKTNHLMWVGGGDSAMYALNADNGKILWRTQLSTEKGAFIWSSPTLYHGNIYVGLASVSDCPLVRGGLYQLNALTGHIKHVFYTVPPACVGGGIWGSPTIDYVTGYLYVATGNAGSCRWGRPASRYAPALVRLRASNLHVVDYWTLPISQQIDDPDFGSTPTLFSATIHGSTHFLVGVANKNGKYYAFNRYSLAGSPVWSAQIALPGQPEAGFGSISPSAWDGRAVYAAGGMTTIHGASCIGSVRALDPANGHFLWENCIRTGQRFGAVLGAVMAVPGVVMIAAGVELRAVNAFTGKTLFSFHDTKGVFYGAATVSNGALYAADTAGNLLAFSPPASKAMVSRFRATIGPRATTFRWTAAEAVGIKGFRIYAGNHALTESLIKPSPSLRGVYESPWHKQARFTIKVVMVDGTSTFVGER